MEQRKYKTKQEVLIRGQEAVGKTLGEIDKTGRIATGKGAIGTVVEESWFGYKPNSNPAPDFEEAGVLAEVQLHDADPTAVHLRGRTLREDHQRPGSVKNDQLRGLVQRKSPALCGYEQDGT